MKSSKAIDAPTVSSNGTIRRKPIERDDLKRRLKFSLCPACRRIERNGCKSCNGSAVRPAHCLKGKGRAELAHQRAPAGWSASRLLVMSFSSAFCGSANFFSPSSMSVFSSASAAVVTGSAVGSVGLVGLSSAPDAGLDAAAQGFRAVRASRGRMRSPLSEAGR